MFWWKQHHQVAFLWLCCPFVNKKTIKKEQSESDCKYWKVNGKCKIDSRKNQSFFIVGCLIPKCLFFRKSNHNVFSHFCGFLHNKIILQVLHIFSMHLFLFWNVILNKEYEILHHLELKQCKFDFMKRNWFEIIFHWFRFFPFLRVCKI